jgi:hypothetical protein
VELKAILPESLCLLLSSPSLKSISSCDTLTDDVLQEAANLHSFNKLESFELSECNLVTIKILDLLMKATNPLEWIWLTWKQREPKGFKKILCRWKKQMAKNHWNVSLSADYYDDVSDVESEDEEITDSDEEISDVDSEEIYDSDSEDSPAEDSEESSSTDSNEELLIIDG